MGSQPFDEQPVALRLNCRWLPHVEIGVRVTKGELPVRVSRDHVAEDQPEPDGLELRQPGSLIEKVRYEQVGVDDRLGDHPGHGCGAHVRKGAVSADRTCDEVQDARERIGPSRIVGLRWAGVDLSVGDALRLTGGIAASCERPPERMCGHDHIINPRHASTAGQESRPISAC